MVPRKYLEKLRGDLAGRLLEAGDPGYDQALVIDNGRIDLRPGVVAMCVNRKTSPPPTSSLSSMRCRSPCAAAVTARPAIASIRAGWSSTSPA